MHDDDGREREGRLFGLIPWKSRYIGESTPYGYRVAYLDWFIYRDICFPVGIHWIARIIRRLWEFSHHCRPSAMERAILKARGEGRDAAWKQFDQQQQRIDAQTATVLNPIAITLRSDAEWLRQQTSRVEFQELAARMEFASYTIDQRSVAEQARDIIEKWGTNALEKAGIVKTEEVATAEMACHLEGDKTRVFYKSNGERKEDIPVTPCGHSR